MGIFLLCWIRWCDISVDFFSVVGVLECGTYLAHAGRRRWVGWRGNEVETRTADLELCNQHKTELLSLLDSLPQGPGLDYRRFLQNFCCQVGKSIQVKIQLSLPQDRCLEASPPSTDSSPSAF